MTKSILFALSLIVCSTAMAQSPTGIQSALTALVNVYGENAGPALILGDQQPPNCKVYLNFLYDGQNGPVPATGVRMAVEHISYILFAGVVTARQDFSGSTDINSLLSGNVDANGTISFTGLGGSTLSVTKTATGAMVSVNGLSCSENGRILF